MSTTATPPRQSTPRTGGGGIPGALAALIGLVSVAAALGAGHLAAALVSPPSSPFLAVGDTVIRFSPQWLTEFAKTTFGTADKPVLLGGMAVVILGIAAAGGLLSRRTALPGTAVVVVLGLVGLAVVALAPGFALLDLVASLVALATGLAAFLLLHQGAAASVPTAPAPAESAPAGSAPARSEPARSGPAASGPAGPAPAADRPVSRRSVLVGTSAVGVGALAAAGAGQLIVGDVGESRAAVTARIARLRLAETAPPVPPAAAFPESIPFVTPNDAFYRVDTALQVPAQSAADWTCRVHGMVDREITLTFDDLLSRPLVERTITMTCVSNEVGGPYVSTADFIGVELRDVLLEAGVRPGADQILSTSLDDWTAGTPTDVVMEPGRGALLAIGMNGEALPAEHGFPVRMLVPGLYGFLSATKWLADIELTTFAAAQGYWLQRGWGRFAPIKTQCRIDTPRGFQQVPAGRVTVAGIAWSQPVGIGRVEVRVDDGPWQDAELAAEVNPSTWRMWRATLDLGPGTHRVQSRATDAEGVTQPEERVPPIPDGATGWPLVVFTVT